MNDNERAADAFWTAVAELAPVETCAALLPHTASLRIQGADGDDEQAAVRHAFTPMLHKIVAQADERVEADLARRGYEPVPRETLVQAVCDLDLGDTDWSAPTAVIRIGDALGVRLVLTGSFEFTVTLVRRADRTPLGAQQEVHYILRALDAATGDELARSPLAYRWESLMNPADAPAGQPTAGSEN